ncbi:MAG: DUF1800 family protein [Pseudomonadota bacterium]
MHWLRSSTPSTFRALVSGLAVILLAACGGGGGGGGSTPSTPPGGSTPPTTPPPTVSSDEFATENSASRFLTQATFGPTKNDVSSLTGTDPSAWFLAELDKPATLNLDEVEGYVETFEPLADDVSSVQLGSTSFTFWRNAVTADDQLRQRMAFALSQILVVSNFGGEALSDIPEAVGYYQDILTQNALGNYRELLEAVTYSPAMAEYLTYLGNRRADPATGRVPDENYAREILQLMTVGVLDINPDGTLKLDSSGQPIEIYDNTDITGLAKVFTGLFFAGVLTVDDGFDFFDQDWAAPLAMYNGIHSMEEKSFLGTTIPSGTDGVTSIDLALDHIMSMPQVGPFIGRQLIQRFTTSDPDADYVSRVASAFDSGAYTLPNGTVVGDGRKGDLSATIAAILFDPDARMETALADTRFGKIREPILRFTHWARAFGVDANNPEYNLTLYATENTNALSQHPYRARSVFNFYRPGYIAPGTQSGALGLTVPELQIVNASSTPGYINFMTYHALGVQEENDGEAAEVAALFADSGVAFDDATYRRSFVATYTEEKALAGDVIALVDHLDDLLTYGTMSSSSKSEIVATLQSLGEPDLEDPDYVDTIVEVGVVLVMTSPDYLVQR